MKRCRQCGEDLTIESFGVQSGTQDGRRKTCKKCMRENERGRRAADPARARQIDRDSYWRNHAAKLERQARYRRANPERMARLKREWIARNPTWWHKGSTSPAARKRRERWAAKNPDARASISRRRYARSRGAKGDCSLAAQRMRIEVWGWRCWICSDAYDQVDHVIPLSRGGSNWPANLRPICSCCNKIKAGRVVTATSVEAIRQRSMRLKVNVARALGQVALATEDRWRETRAT